jgi:hypothetical protein
VKPWTFLLSAALAVAGAACTCSSLDSSIPAADGGALVCVVPEDCPRTGTEIICVTNSNPDYTSTCVTCRSNQCIRVVTSCP